MAKKSKQTIYELPAAVVAKIAAGQVVERPASVVKELVENALDAGAEHIFVSLENGGIEKITVSDDGLGMSKQDLQLSFKHHTTSKITTESDLLQLKSFGFRGEALSSIAAVATLRIETKQETAVGGTSIELEAGKVIDSGPVGMPTGTRVIVSGLFSSIPARKKFLKSVKTELRHCREVIVKIALAHPATVISLTHNGSVLFDFPKEKLDQRKEALENRLEVVFGKEFTEQLLPISFSTQHVTVNGYIGKPQLATPSKYRQFLFVNNRPVEHELLVKKLKEVFGTLIEPRSYPAFVLYLTASPDLFDVNVDPQKTQVKFVNESKVLLALQEKVAEVLTDANLGVSKRAGNLMYEEFEMDPGIAQIIKSEGSGWNVKDAELLEDTEVLQVHKLYLLAQTKRGLLLVDQHAAHERILFYEYLEKFKQKRFETVALKKSIKLALPQQEQAVLAEEHQVFEKIGFTFSKKYSEVTQIPKVFETRNIPKLLQELLHDVLNIGEIKQLDVGTHRTLSYLACRTAIKAGEILTPKERKRLLQKLAKTPGKYTCPHGRPIEVELDITYLEKLFKRA